MVSFFAGKGADPDEARELAQEAFLRAFRNLPRFEEKASHSTWLYTIAQNVWRNQIRARMTGKRTGLEISLDIQPTEGKALPLKLAERGPQESDPLRNVLETERKRLLKVEIDQLPARARQAIMLRIYHDLQYDEIAAIMQVNINTVKALIHQAKARLRDRLTIHFGDFEL